MPESITGSCLCGKITLKIAGFERPIIACHCQQCRKQTGSYVMAAATDTEKLVISGEEHLKWYAATNSAKRGFCRHCASLLFWQRNDSSSISIMAGCLDSPTGLHIEKHIFVANKGDYYDIADEVPQYKQSR